MKKFTFIFAFIAIAFGFSYGQATFIATTPSNNATSSFRLPNGTSNAAYFRGASLVLTSELTAIPVSTTLTTIGFTTTTGANTAVTGSITIYLQNTGDGTFNKGTTWSGVTPGMTTVYTGTITIPTGASTTDVTLTTPFVFLGSGMYVAYDFVSAGPFATTGAVWASNSTGLVGGCISGTSASASPTSCVTSSFRPCVRFGYPNALTNDVSVDLIYGLGSVSMVLGGSTSHSAIIRNNSNGPLSNINVNLNLTGVNTFTDMQTVSSLGAGATATVNFAPWTPLALGANTINVSVPSDQNNTNNSKNFLNMVTCYTGGYNENPAIYNTSVGFNTGSGIIATQVQLPVTATVTGANLAISSNTAAPGNNIYAALLDNTGLILATSNTLNISSGDLNTIKTFTFASPVALTAGQIWHIGMAQTPNATLGYFPVAAYSSPMIPVTYNTAALTGGTLTPLVTNLGIFGFEANFMGTCVLGVNSVVSGDNSLLVYPNPANSSVFVKLNSVSDKATVEVYNTIGQIVISSKEINNNSTEINVSALAKGVYILKITNGKEVGNVKIVVEH
jgi:hypothetical protein